MSELRSIVENLLKRWSQVQREHCYPGRVGKSRYFLLISLDRVELIDLSEGLGDALAQIQRAVQYAMFKHPALLGELKLGKDSSEGFWCAAIGSWGWDETVECAYWSLLGEASGAEAEIALLEAYVTALESLEQGLQIVKPEQAALSAAGSVDCSDEF